MNAVCYGGIKDDALNEQTGGGEQVGGASGGDEWGRDGGGSGGGNGGGEYRFSTSRGERTVIWFLQFSRTDIAPDS